MTLKKKLFIIFGTILAIPIVIIAYILISDMVKTHQAKVLVSSSRQAIEPTADKATTSGVEILMYADAKIKKIASSKVDVCYVNHADSGWFASSWYQDCYLRYIDGFSTSLSGQALSQKLASDAQVELYFGKPKLNLPLTEQTSCTLFEKNFQSTVLFRPANTASTAYDCHIPDQLQGLWSVRGPIIQNDELSVHVSRKFDASQLDHTQNQVWLVSDYRYYHEELGCGLGILCTNPRNKPAHVQFD